MIIIELFSDSIAIKNAKVQTIGALIQGLYIWYSLCRRPFGEAWKSTRSTLLPQWGT